MKKQTLATLICTLLLISCNKEKRELPATIEKITDVAVELHNGIDFTINFYTYTPKVPEKDTILLGIALKERGFKDLGPVSKMPHRNGQDLFYQTYKKDSCRCEVLRIYTYDSYSEMMRVSESMNCFTPYSENDVNKITNTFKVPFHCELPAEDINENKK